MSKPNDIPPTDPSCWLVALVARGDGPDFPVRVRLALKRLLRSAALENVADGPLGSGVEARAAVALLRRRQWHAARAPKGSAAPGAALAGWLAGITSSPGQPAAESPEPREGGDHP